MERKTTARKMDFFLLSRFNKTPFIHFIPSLRKQRVSNQIYLANNQRRKYCEEIIGFSSLFNFSA